ncbi:NADase-type glycan-binding domain-containing protein [Streptomyces wuyuanensis]|uniref:NADase-type glycan-binding domain-containing protein n=1 Tax=Streptomyces wuyuanensis TaxID=1196353 RepID=UPI003444A4E9
MGGLLFCASCMLYATYAPFRNSVDDQASGVQAVAKGFLESHYSPTRPANVTASDFAKGHEAGNLIDLNTATYWSAPYRERDGQKRDKPTLVVEFDRVVNLDQLIMTAGAAESFTEHGRPRQVILTFTNEREMRLQLQDTAKPQKFSLRHAFGVKSVQIEIVDVYPSRKGHDVAVTDVEFFSLLS